VNSLRFHFIFCCITVVLGLGATDCHAGDIRGRMVGTVVDSKGEPLSDVNVTLTNTNMQTQIFQITTNQKGRFTQVGMDPVLHKIVLEKDGYVRVEDTVKVRAGQKDEYEWKMLTVEELIALTPVAPEEMARRLFNDAADLYNAGKTVEAKAKLEESIEKNPTLAAAYLLKANIAMQEEQYADVISATGKALEIEEGNVDAYYLLGAAYNRQERYPEAIEAWNKYLAQKPEDAAIQFNVGALLLNAKKVDEALAAFLNVIKHKADFAEAYKIIGNIYLQKSEHAKAREMLTKYLELAPDAPDASDIKDIVSILPK